MAEGRSEQPLSPPPILEFRPEWIPAYLSNGLMGIRCGPIPLIEGLAIVSGLAATQPVDLVEGFARGPYPCAGDIQLDRHLLSRVPGLARFREQRYDFSCGELTSRFDLVADGKRAEVQVLAFCSRTMPTLVCQQITVRVSEPCRLRIAAGVDQRQLAGSLLSRETETPGGEKPVTDGILLWEPMGGLTRCGAAYITRFEGAGQVHRAVERFDQTAPLRTSYELDAVPGATYVLEQITSLVASQFHQEPHRQASRLADMGAQVSWEVLREENRRHWRELWRGRIQIDCGDVQWQQLADAAFYYLQASAHPSSLFSTAMFGLAFWPNYHYYAGHVMWDVEAFALPALLLSAPESAAALLTYRSDHISAAELNAALNGYGGIQFPWASGPVHGQEAIRTNAPTISFEQHVNMCVALAFANFVHATGDEDFLRERAWPVLDGVAHWIASRVTRTGRGTEFKRTLGIAEQGSPVDNNAYVNMAAAVTLREAAHVAELMGRRHDARAWRELAGEIYLPIDKSLGVVLNHDGFDPSDHGLGASTPETLFGIWPWGYALAPDLEQATIKFYLGRVEPYIGYPMLNSLLGVWAARIGDRARSLELFRRGYADYINDPFRETDEFSRTRFPERPRVGPMTANLSGFLLALTQGLTGLSVGPDDPAQWCRRAVVLPEGWRSIEVERLWARGRPMRLRAAHGQERAELLPH